ncbi:MAG: hypothetical protein HC882_02235 [Acidobacteria bacterium]|nr:hypothetical protein [Acidobacteriota bacterium]
MRRANELRQELAAARVNYTEQHPRVQQLIRELAQVEQRLKSLEAHSSDPGEQASSETISPIDLEIRQQKLILQRLKEQSVTIRADIAEFQRRIDATPRVSQELAELSKGLDVLRDRYRSYQSDFEEARGSLRIEEERKGSQFEIVERASIPTVPVSPKPLQLLVLGIAGGPMALIGPLVAFLVLRQRVHSAAGIALLTDVPVLAVVPELPTRRRAIRTTIRHVVNAALTSAGGVTLAMAVSRFGVEGLLP